jgi:hypothetical protein
MAISATLNIVAGDTVSYSGVVRLPTGTWSGECVARDSNGELFELDVALTLVGPAVESGKFDWAIVLSAPASRTASWNSVGGAKKDAVARIRFTDGSPTPVVTTSAPFTVAIAGVPPS